MNHEKPTRKNRVLKSEKSMDDAEFLKERRGGSHYRESSSTMKDSAELDILPEEICLESYSETPRRGSICEELEKGIFQGGISLHKMRKAMVIQETLKDRFLMWTWSENTRALCLTQCWKGGIENTAYLDFCHMLRPKMTETTAITLFASSTEKFTQKLKLLNLKHLWLLAYTSQSLPFTGLSAADMTYSDKKMNEF